MKKLLIPLLIALLSGVAGGTSLTVLRVSKMAAADTTLVAKVASDDVVDHAQPSDSHDENSSSDTAAHETRDSLMTPAESLRAVAASRTALETQTAARGIENAHVDTAKQVKAPAARAVADLAGAKDSIQPAKSNASSIKDAANAVDAARNTALATALPEERLAKIFSAMQAKDAARVLDQMEDRDIRAVLSLMGDRQVAAILSALPAPRAATITKGALKAAGADK